MGSQASYSPSLMFKLVTGKQRQGKTAYLAHLIADILKNTDRNVLTDIPIDRNEMCKHIRRNIGDRLKILTKLERLRFLDHKQGTHTDIFIDEAYQLFPSFAVSGLLSNEEKAQYQAYIMEHNKFHDNIFFICHDFSMLHSSVRLGVESYIRVQHSYTVSMCNWFLLKGLTYPKKFFIVREFWDRKEFESKIGIPDNQLKLYPYKALFKIYNTNKASNGLQVGTQKKVSHFVIVPGPTLPGQDSPLKIPVYEQNKLKKEYAYNSWTPYFFNWLKSKAGLLILIIFTGCFLFTLGSKFYDFVLSKSKPKKTNSVKVEKLKEEIQTFQRSQGAEQSTLLTEATREEDFVSQSPTIGKFLYRSNNIFNFENYKFDLDEHTIKYYRGRFWIEEKFFSYSAFSLFTVDFVESMKRKKDHSEI